MIKKKKKKYSTNEVCTELDVTKNTLFKWEKEGKIKKVEKDWRGWRLFSDENVDEIRNIIQSKKKSNL
ncbi:MAG: MerR family transcriptional regulator [bacterium]|nr:MerR family transcriptional regulator [bacterium]